MNTNIWLEGIMGVVVGDALGMPVQFVDRPELKKSPVTGMTGYGTYDMPPGTWSDDSSMTVATLASIKSKQGIDCEDIMRRFVRWHFLGKYTPAGESFDQGNTCLGAILHYVKHKDIVTCGRTGEWANGNGALMRIMPVCLYAYIQHKKGTISLEKAVDLIHQVSALTHNHTRSKMACGIYFFLVQAILEVKGLLQDKLQAGMNAAKEFYCADVANLTEWYRYSRMENIAEFAMLSEEEIKSSGYVVDTLEAAVWSLITTESFEEGLLRSVNLGDDTDTVGAVAGGLAGLHYGYHSIPAEWREAIIRKEELVDICVKMKEVVYVR